MFKNLSVSIILDDVMNYTNFPKMFSSVFWNWTNTEDQITSLLSYWCTTAAPNFCMRKQTFADLCDQPAQSFGIIDHEWQSPYRPERQAALCKPANQDCYESVASHQSTVRLLDQGKELQCCYESCLSTDYQQQECMWNNSRFLQERASKLHCGNMMRCVHGLCSSRRLWISNL